MTKSISKKNSSVVSSTPVNSSISSTPVNSSISSISSVNDFPAIPIMFDRLRRLNHAIGTLQGKVNALEQAIAEAPINLQAIADDLKINAYIKLQESFGVTMPKNEAIRLLGLIRNNQPVNLTGPIVRATGGRTAETLELKANDLEILNLYRSYGFLSHSEFCKRIQSDGIKVTSAVLSRYSGIAKQIAYLEGKQGNNGYLADVQVKGVTPIEILERLSAHKKYSEDASTFALTKRAVRIYAALTA